MPRRPPAPMRFPILVLLVFGAALSFAQNNSSVQTVIPNLIRFGGVLLNDHQVPRAGTVGVTFALYADQKGGAPLWLETQNVTADDTGHYSVLLGFTRTEGLPAELFASGTARWLGVKAEGQDEQPRVLLVSVPYALKAGDAETLGGLPASSFALAVSGAVRNGTTVAQPTSIPSGPQNLVAPIAQNGPAPAPPPTQNATDFTDSTTDQVLLVTQNGPSTSIVNRNYAVWGIANGDTGVGIRGEGRSPNSSAIGIWGVSYGSTGTGLLGEDVSATGANWGLRGKSQSTTGTGLAGWALATSGNTVGINATVSSPTGTGILVSGAGGKLLTLQTNGTNKFSVDGTGSVSASGAIQSSSGGFKFPDNSTQTTAGISQTAADARYLGTSGTVGATQLSGTYSNALTFNNAGNSFTGNGNGLTNLNSANLTGALNSSNLPNIAFTNAQNNFTQLQNVEVSGPAGGTGVGLFVLSNDNSHAAINAANAGSGDIMDMYNANQQAFAFANNGYLWSNGWAPPITYVSAHPVTPGQLVKFVRILGPDSTPEGVVMPMATTDINGAIGIVAQTYTSDPNNLQAQVVLDGIANCTFDNTPVIGDWVTISSTTAGECHDNGVGLPNYGEAVGRVVDSSGTVYLFRIWIVGPRIPQSVGLTNQTAAIPSTTLFHVGGSGLYRVTVYMTSNNTAGGTITGGLAWTDGSGAQTASTGTVSPTQQYASQTVVMHVIGGNDITYNIQFSGVSGTPNYGVFYTVEVLANE